RSRSPLWNSASIQTPPGRAATWFDEDAAGRAGRSTLARRPTIVEFAMPPYRRLGSLPPKRHITHPQEPGFRGEGIYYEEVGTTAGFGRAYSVCYHLRPPTRVRQVEAAGTVPLETVAESELRHHHFRTGALKPAGDPITGRVSLLVNND